MPAIASAVIVGGGIVGSSIAYYLAEKGQEDVVLLERESIAAVTTGLSGALVRMHYTNPWDAALALKSLNVFTNWHDLIGGDCGFRKTGFIVIVGPQDGDKLTKNLPMSPVLAAFQSEPFHSTTSLMTGYWERRSASLVSSYPARRL